MITIGNLTGFAKGSGCVGKKSFSSYAEAEPEIGRLLRKNAARFEDGFLAPYLCPECGAYHLGHNRPVAKKKRRRRTA
jgi:hypothetical protein